VRRNGSGWRAPRRSQNSRTILDLPTPASPRTVTRRGVPSASTAANSRSRISISLSRPTNERFRPSTPRGRMSDSARRRRLPTTPSGLPLATTDCGSSNSNAPRTDATVRSPTRMSPGCAACSRRAATFTASPVTNELCSRGLPTTTSPVFTPIRRESVSPNNSRMRRCIASAACSARSA
jgi:hypothetical protein